MRALRSFIFDLLFYGWTALCCIPGILLALIPWRAPLAFFAPIWVWWLNFFEIAVLNLHTTMHGKENFPPAPFIAAIQHQSAWETPKLLLWFKDPAIVMKAELLKLPLWGFCVMRYGCIPVARSKKPEDLRNFIDAAKAMAAQKRPIVMFPQGTRTMEAGRPYSRGVAVLYEALHIPVVPITLNSGTFWPKHGDKKPGTVTVTVHPPIQPGLEREALMEALRHLYEKGPGAA